MAQAYASSGDLGSARAELEPLLAANARDTQSAQQLSKLAEEEGDLESAARYQKQLNDLAPSDEGTSRLAQLYARYGELEEAQAVWSKMAAGKGERSTGSSRRSTACWAQEAAAGGGDHRRR